MMTEIKVTVPKSQYVKDLKPGVKVNSTFMCDKVKFKESRTGDHFADVMLIDRTGVINMKVWNMSQIMAEWLQPGLIVSVNGPVVKEYAGSFQISMDSDVFLERVKPCSVDECDMSDFVQTTEQDINRLVEEIRTTVDTVKALPISCLLRSYFDDDDFMKKFRIWPAAIKHHHAYRGGLIEHTVSVLRICLTLGDIYKVADRDMLIAGALLHDVGKVKSYTYDVAQGGISVSDCGVMFDHIVMGSEDVGERIHRMEKSCPKRTMGCKCFSEPEVLAIKHMILSHHGALEWGSPVEPVTIEACILHHADNMDAQVNKFNKAIMDYSASCAGQYKFIEVIGRPVLIPKVR